MDNLLHFDLNEWTSVHWASLQAMAGMVVIAGLLTSRLIFGTKIGAQQMLVSLVVAIVGVWFANQIFPAVTGIVILWIVSALVALAIWWLFVVLLLLPAAEVAKHAAEKKSKPAKGH